LTCKHLYTIGAKTRELLEEERSKQVGEPHTIVPPYEGLRESPTIAPAEGFTAYSQLRGDFNGSSVLSKLLKEWMGPAYIFLPRHRNKFIKIKDIFKVVLGFKIAEKKFSMMHFIMRT
jgi:hypothetical protein